MGHEIEVSVVIPTLNEEESIGKVLDKIPKRDDWEIIIVDSYSKDRTVEIAKSKGAIVVMERRRGYGRAYKTGFSHARGKIIVTLDADDTYPAERIEEIVNFLKEKNLDFISCERFSNMEKGAMPPLHIIGNIILSVTTMLLFGIKIKDSQSGMWVFRKKILDKLDLRSDGMSFSEEIKIEAWKKGFRCYEYSIEYRPRKGEKKLNTWRDGFNNWIYLFKKWAEMKKK